MPQVDGVKQRWGVTTTAVSAASAGNNTLVAAPGADSRLEIHRLVLTVARGSSVNATLISGTTQKSGAMQADLYDIDFGDSPLVCGKNEAFILHLSAAIAVTGFIQYKTVIV